MTASPLARSVLDSQALRLLPAPWRKSLRRGFSLVEVVLAIGVVAFAFVGIFALLPVGLGVFREAIDTSVSSQIVQRVVSDAQVADFETLTNPSTSSGGSSSGDYFVLPLRYFDDQGTEVVSTSGNSLTSAQQLQVVYYVRVRGSKPGKANPASHSNAYFTSLPSKAGVTRYNPRDLTILTIQIVTNPANRDLAQTLDASTQLIKPALAKTQGMRVQTYSEAIARNGKK